MQCFSMLIMPTVIFNETGTLQLFTMYGFDIRCYDTIYLKLLLTNPSIHLIFSDTGIFRHYNFCLLSEALYSHKTDNQTCHLISCRILILF